ncbi:MAG: hypothetical protein EA427_03045 [Spirochaetaceae bacterium]|nr:MAG: hypothetical protein EA427_03045 [Spirochaetaceae bacterium]
MLFLPQSDPSFATGEAALYSLDTYPERFRDPALMYDSERGRAEQMLDWPTDGVPTMRPNLGTILVPASAGQPWELRRGAMPWPGESLSREEIRALRDVAIEKAELFRRAIAFYGLAARTDRAVPYQADGQGVFDIAHLLYGDRVFLELATGGEEEWITDLLEVSLDLFLRATEAMKKAIGEPPGEMVHGHATPQGLYFPGAGTRISEDTATLLSPAMIEERLLPAMQRSVEPFGGAFVHYCGSHRELYEMLCHAPWCVAIDLGNPESYEFSHLAHQASRTGTVLYSRVASEGEEGWREYITRVATVIRETGLRAVIRPTVYPDTREECREMLAIFHAITA